MVHPYSFKFSKTSICQQYTSFSLIDTMLVNTYPKYLPKFCHHSINADKYMESGDIVFT